MPSLYSVPSPTDGTVTMLLHRAAVGTHSGDVHRPGGGVEVAKQWQSGGRAGPRSRVRFTGFTRSLGTGKGSAS